MKHPQLRPEQILLAPEQVIPYACDWTKNLSVRATGVFFPTSDADVVEIVRWARREKIALVPSGGRTGLSGGAAAVNGEYIVSFERMNQILSFDENDRVVECEAGVITETLQQYAREKGYYYPVDFAARGSSQIGGNIATNAGGIKVLRYGLTRDWVAGLQVVTGAGDILHLNKNLVKNATGLDLRHLWIGSEGILGFIVRAGMKLASAPPPLSVMLLALPNLESVMNVFRSFRDRTTVTAFEFFSDRALALVRAQTQLPDPLSTAAPYYVLVEAEAPHADAEAHIGECLEAVMEKGWVIDGAIAQNDAQAKQFWRYREDISESAAPRQPYKNDVSVPISKVPAFLAAADQMLSASYPDFEVIWFGHIGDGNLHINILRPPSLSATEFVKHCEQVNESLFALISGLGGSISAEHGVGVVKRPFLHFTRSAEEVRLMRSVKNVFDPDGIINPGKIFL